VADVLLKAASAAPKVRYTAGGVAWLLQLLRRFAPAGLVDAGGSKGTCGSTRWRPLGEWSSLASGQTALVAPAQLMVPNRTVTGFYIGAYLALPELIQST